MCITTLAAELKKTRIGVWDVLHPTFGYRHVLAYQNNPQNLSDQSNCMLLHIPSKEPLTPDCIINTENDVEFLMQMEKPFSPIVRGELKSFDNHIIEMGVYNIALLNDISATAVEETLQQIPVGKRPEIPAAFLDFYKETFPRFPLILCCFNNKDTKNASPIMIHFKPKYPDVFMFPTLDSHGSVPNLREKVWFEQTLITGSYQLQKEGNGFQSFELESVSEELLPWLPKYGTAVKLDTQLSNKDILIDARVIRAGGDTSIKMGILGKHISKN